MQTALEPKASLTIPAPKTRTLDAMKRDAHRPPPAFPTADEAPAGRRGLDLKKVKRFLPTLAFSKYNEEKAKGLTKSVQIKVAGRGRTTTPGNPHGSAKTQPFWAASPVSLVEPLAPALAPANLILVADIEGATDVDGEMPPDTHGAVGLQQFVEVTNSHIDIFQKNDPTNRTSIPYAAFFAYSAQALFDARAVYDSVWNRWIITAEAFPETPDVQYHFIAVSTTSSATDPFWIYQINVTFNSGDFWDFPQLGMDQDAMIITANIFDGSGNYKGADMFAVAKARLYNGLGFSVPVFTGLVGTLAPPIVLDQNANTFLIAAEPSGSALKMYALTNSSRPAAITLAGPVDVPVDAYDLPPQGVQPGGCQPLDTSDCRFVNASTQVGDSLWNTHTINVGNLPTPRYYQIDTPSNSVVQSGFFYASSSSNDFNASIAANGDNDVFVTWTSTDPDPAANINAQVRFSACDHNAGACGLGAGSASPYTSPTCFNGGRWGDYSAVTIDPTDSREAWVVNEDVTSNGDWGSRIDAVHLP